MHSLEKESLSCAGVCKTCEYFTDCRRKRGVACRYPIDGNEQRHNKIKFSADKQGTYRTVVDNVNKIAEIIPNVYITLRINYDAQTLKNIQDVIRDIDEKSKPHIHVDFQKVWQVPFTQKDVELLKEVKEEFRLQGLTSDFRAYRPGKFYRCYADKIHQYAINYDGRIFKCTARDYGEDKVIGRLAEDGRVNWNDKLMSKLFVKPTFENERCLKCQKLPLCMGPCIQQNYDARTEGTDIPCISRSAQYTLESYIIEDAKKRELIN